MEGIEKQFNDVVHYVEEEKEEPRSKKSKIKKNEMSS